VTTSGAEGRPARRPLRGDPEALFWRAYQQYWNRRYEDALETLDAAISINGKDARYWYYKALAERALGYGREAVEAARRAVALRQQNQPGLDLIGTALERVQGPDRQFLNQEP
jgi:tetratricopeptide (TPR) repeat protein